MIQTRVEAREKRVKGNCSSDDCLLYVSHRLIDGLLLLRGDVQCLSFSIEL